MSFNRGNSIIPVQPATQIDQPAPLAAKGKKPGIHVLAAVHPGRGGWNRLSTYWTRKIHDIYTFILKIRGLDEAKEG